VRTFINEDGLLETRSVMPEPTPEELREKKRISARCGHVKRRLSRDEPLTGELLEFALDVLGEGNFAGKGELSTAEKLKAGQQLNEYEFHIMVDVLLLHTRLGAG